MSVMSMTEQWRHRGRHVGAHLFTCAVVHVKRRNSFTRLFSRVLNAYTKMLSMSWSTEAEVEMSFGSELARPWTCRGWCLSSPQLDRRQQSAHWLLHSFITCPMLSCAAAASTELTTGAMVMTTNDFCHTIWLQYSRCQHLTSSVCGSCTTIH